jgi:hypothetical protein
MLLVLVAQVEPAFALSIAGLEQPQQEATPEPAIEQAETSLSEATPTPMRLSAMQAETALSEATPTPVQPEYGPVDSVPPAALQQPIEQQDGVEAAAGQSGTVLSLSLSGGSNHNETITISTAVQAISRINNSNFHFEIRTSEGMVVATHNYGDVPRMNAAESFSYSWSSNNSSYPLMGDYSVTLCWSTGGSQNCNIASATTTFYAANSLGAVLTFSLVALVARWLWSKRKMLFGAAGETT